MSVRSQCEILWGPQKGTTRRTQHTDIQTHQHRHTNTPAHQPPTHQHTDKHKTNTDKRHTTHQQTQTNTDTHTGTHTGQTHTDTHTDTDTRTATHKTHTGTHTRHTLAHTLQAEQMAIMAKQVFRSLSHSVFLLLFSHHHPALLSLAPSDTHSPKHTHTSHIAYCRYSVFHEGRVYCLPCPFGPQCAYKSVHSLSFRQTVLLLCFVCVLCSMCQESFRSKKSFGSRLIVVFESCSLVVRLFV